MFKRFWHWLWGPPCSHVWHRSMSQPYLANGDWGRYGWFQEERWVCIHCLKVKTWQNRVLGRG